MDHDQMKNQRKILHQMLVDILGSNNVYFQPPESFKLKYPCIIYRLAYIDNVYADNIPYLHKRRYSITVIDRDPESIIRDKITDLKTCSFERSFTSDDLYHTVFNMTF